MKVSILHYITLYSHQYLDNRDVDDDEITEITQPFDVCILMQPYDLARYITQ